VSVETKIQRYAIHRDNPLAHEHGQYVLYTDHLKAMEDAKDASWNEGVKVCRKQLSDEILPLAGSMRPADGIAFERLTATARRLRQLKRPAEKVEAKL
jgi:hypothetical protein